MTLNLGGESAAILLDDVDSAAFAPLVASVCTPNTGQTRRALTWVLPRSRYDEIVDAVSSTLAALPQGDPMNPATVFAWLV